MINYNAYYNKKEKESIDGKRQTTMKMYYPYYKEKTTDTALFTGGDLDALLKMLANLLNGGVDGFRSSLLQSDPDGSAAILLNFEEFRSNPFLMREIITILREHQDKKHGSDQVQADLVLLLENQFVKYSFFKFTDSLPAKERAKERYVIKPDGFCIYRLVLLQFMAFTSHPSNCGAYNDPDRMRRYNKLLDLIDKYGQTSLFEGKQDSTSFHTMFNLFWKRVVLYLEGNDTISDLNEKYDLPDEPTTDYCFQKMLIITKEMLKWLNDDKNHGKSLPNHLWFEVNHLRLLAIVLGNMKWPSSCKIQGLFLMNVFRDIESCPNGTTSIQVSGLPNNLQNLSCYLLTQSSIRHEKETSEDQESFNITELKVLSDPFTFSLFAENHMSMLRSSVPKDQSQLPSEEITNSVDIGGLCLAMANSLMEKVKVVVNLVNVDDQRKSPVLGEKEMKKRKADQSSVITIQSTISTASPDVSCHDDLGIVRIRHAEILKEAQEMKPTCNAIELTANLTTRDLYGTHAVVDIRANSVLRLATLDDTSELDSDSINCFGNLINMASYGSEKTCEIFSVETYTLQTILSTSDDNIINNIIHTIHNQGYVELRLKICLVALFPMHTENGGGHYMLIVVFPKEYMIIFLDSMTDSGKIEWKKSVMRKIVQYCNSIFKNKKGTKSYDDWISYIDGEDESIPSIIQQGPTLNCGVYVISYMREIERNYYSTNSAVELINIFKNKGQRDLFKDINPSTILSLRQRITVALVDRVD